MSRYHIKDDGNPGLCKAEEGACPKGGDHFDTQSDARAAAESLLAQAHPQPPSLSKKEKKKQALEDYDVARAEWKNHKGRIDAKSHSMGVSIFNVKSLEDQISYYEKYDKYLNKTAALTSLQHFKVKDSYNYGEHENVKLAIERYKEALAIRKDLDQLDEVNDKYAIKRMKELVSSYALNDEIDNTPADEDLDKVNALGSALRQEFGVADDYYEGDFKSRAQDFYTARASINAQAYNASDPEEFVFHELQEKEFYGPSWTFATLPASHKKRIARAIELAK